MPLPPLRTFVAAVSVAGLVLLAVLAVTGAGDALDRADTLLVLLAVAIFVAELFPIDVPGEEGEFSFSTTFAFALLLADGLVAVVLVHAIALALAEVVRRRPLERLVFNVAQYTLCWGATGGVLDALTGDLPDRAGLQYLDAERVPALVAAAAVFLLLNTALASTPPALARRTSPLASIRSDFGFIVWSTAVLCALVPVVLVVSDYDLALFPLLGIPLVAIQLGSRQAVINEEQASHDALTGLPNRVHLTRALRDALRRAERRGERLGVLIVDLHGLKEINDTLGHRRGDLVLQEVGSRVAALAPRGGLAARLGGDEFGLLAPVATDDCIRLARQAIAALEEPMSIHDIALHVSASVGIACHPEHGRSVDALLRHADVALDNAKEARRGWLLYDDEFDRHSLERLALVAELRRGIDDGELVLHYQPKVELTNGALRGVEALVRWRHPTRGLLEPFEFIELAEHTGLIRPLTLAVVEAALDQAERWRAKGLDVPVAVNLSVRSITRELPRDLARILARRERGADALQLEITETIAMGDEDEALEVLRALARLGIRLSVDDFGTGYSSLAYLRRLPVSEIKIDRAFVMAMDRDEGDRAIVRSTIGLARHLGLEVVAEGVQSRAALDEIRALGCTYAQGFYISGPLEADELTRWARSARRARSASGPGRAALGRARK